MVYNLNFIKLESNRAQIAGNGVSFLKHEVRWVFTYLKTKAAISPDPCDGDHNCILNVNESKSYWANIFVNPTLPVVCAIIINLIGL